MSDRVNDGGPAFPNPSLADENYRPQPGDNGMTLRDHFAGQALVGLGIGFGERDVQWFEQYGGKAAYRIADAMIAAREGGKQ